MTGWNHQLDGHEFEQVPRVGDGQGSLACCRVRHGVAEWDMTEWLNWTDTVAKNPKLRLKSYTMQQIIKLHICTYIGVCVCVCICVCVYQFSSVTQLCPTLCDPMNCSTPGLPVHHQLQSLSKLMSIESEMTFNHLILCRPLLLLSSIFPNIKVFSNESALHIRWPKYWRCVCVYIYIYIYS